MYTGVTGAVKIGKGTAATVAYISNWSIEDSSDIIEITKLGSKYKEKAVGMQSWSASADGAVDFTDGSQTALFAAKHNGDEVNCNFYLDTTANKEVFFTGKGFIESLSVDLSAEDKGNISISISGNGALEKEITENV